MYVYNIFVFKHIFFNNVFHLQEMLNLSCKYKNNNTFYCLIISKLSTTVYVN